MQYPLFLVEDKFYALHEGLSELDLLTQFSQNLKTIQNLTTTHFTDFEQLITEYLHAGVKIFGMETGIVSRISDQEYFICNAITPGDAIKHGDIFELEGTYCREVVKSSQTLGFPHVGSMDELKEHPVYQNMKLESYISAPIYKDHKIFGTLNFSSTQIRSHGFSEYERELITMMASAIGSFLMFKEKEQMLENINTRVKKLTAFVAHDLRNPLGNIASLADLIPMLDKEESGEYLEAIKTSSIQALEIVHTILEAAILGDGKVAIHKDQYDINEIIQESLTLYKDRFSESGLSFNFQSISVEKLVDKERISQVFSNLISNSIKYAKKGSCIELSIKLSAQEEFQFLIENEMSQEATKIQPGGVTEESSLGFGLEIVNEVLKLHGSELKIETNNERYKASFSL